MCNCGYWEALVGCKMLPQDVATIYILGQHISEVCLLLPRVNREPAATPTPDRPTPRLMGPHAHMDQYGQYRSTSMQYALNIIKYNSIQFNDNSIQFHINQSKQIQFDTNPYKTCATAVINGACHKLRALTSRNPSLPHLVNWSIGSQQWPPNSNLANLVIYVVFIKLQGFELSPPYNYPSVTPTRHFEQLEHFSLGIFNHTQPYMDLYIAIYIYIYIYIYIKNLALCTGGDHPLRLGACGFTGQRWSRFSQATCHSASALSFPFLHTLYQDQTFLA